VEAPLDEADVMDINYPEYWPFFVRAESGQMTGFFYEIVTEALGRMDIEAKWHCYPWGRCQAHVRTGDADAMVTVPTVERLKYSVTHSEPFYMKKLMLFTYAGHPKMEAIKSISDIASLRDLELTVITYVGNGWNDKNIAARGIKTYHSPKLKNVWRMLANKRGDVAIEWPGAAWPDIFKAGVGDEIVETEVSFESMPFHLLVGKGTEYASRMGEFNDVILQMKDDGTIDKIVKRYVTGSPF